jgi:hypothetical protein
VLHALLPSGFAAPVNLTAFGKPANAVSRGSSTVAVAYTSAIIRADLSTVWSVLGDFHGLPNWVTRIRAGEAEGGQGRGPVGSIRRLTLDPNGAVARERLVHYDATAYRYSYEFADEIPFPVRAYRGTVRLRPITETGDTFLEWFGEYDADATQTDQMNATFTAIYREFINDLRTHLNA